MAAPCPRVSIDPPEGWGPSRILLGQLRDLGYQVEEWRVLGHSLLVIKLGQWPAQGVTPGLAWHRHTATQTAGRGSAYDPVTVTDHEHSEFTDRW